MSFVRPRVVAKPAVRLIGFHHAGGSAVMYHPMAAALPADWELLVLDLPGRGKRHAEPPLTVMQAAIDRAVEDVQPWLDAPFALFGHSLGGILAAEVGRVCERNGAPPVWVGVSGRIAPGDPAPPRLSMMSDDALLDELIALGGTPPGIRDTPLLIERLMRIVRADIALLESYAPAADRVPLGCAITAFAGRDDIWAAPSTMQPWASETRGRFRLREYPGNHFYFLGKAFAVVTADVVSEIRSQLP